MFLICGEALFDFFTDADSDDSSSQLGFQAVAGGSPFNVAFGLARLQRKSSFFSGISTDFLGERLVRVLDREGVDRRHLVRVDNASTLAMVQLSSSGSPNYAFYFKDGADSSIGLTDLPQLENSTKAIHVGSYSLVVEPTSSTLLKLIEQQGDKRLVTLDPNVRLKIEPSLELWRERVDSFAQHADIIKVSEEDMASLYDDEEGSSQAAKWLEGRTSLVIITRGENGVSIYTPSGNDKVKTESVEVVDAVGAGDTFQAAMLCWLDEHDLVEANAVAGMTSEQLRRMVTFANTAAGITCKRRGPDLPYRHELPEG